MQNASKIYQLGLVQFEFFIELIKKIIFIDFLDLIIN